MRNLSVIKGMYQGNGVTRRFAIPFEYNDTAQIFVTVTTYDDGDYTYRVLDRTEFTIDEDSVEIVYPKSADDTPISNSQYLTVWRDTDLLQLIDLTNQGAAWPDSIEGSLDKLHQIVQELAEGLSRALKVDIGDPQTPDEKLIAIQDYVLAAAESSRSASASEAGAQRAAEAAATSEANAAESERLASGYADTASDAASRAEDSAISARAYNAPDYDNTKTYQAGEVVTYTDGNSYRALQETTGNEPTNIIYWKKVTDYVGDNFFEVDEYGYIVPMDSPSHSRHWRIDQNGYIVPIEGGDGGYRPDTRSLSAEYLNVTNEGYIKHLRADDVNAGNLSATGNVTAGMLTTPQANITTLTANAVNAGTVTAENVIAGKVTADEVDNKDKVEYLFPASIVAANHGDCQIIKTKSKVLMIDAGAVGQTTANYILQYMSEHGISKVDYFLLTHYHEDHYGNIQYYIAQNNIDFSNTLWIIPIHMISEDTTGYNLVKQWLTGRNTLELDRDMTLRLEDNVTAEIYGIDASARAYYDSQESNLNERSIQCLVRHGDIKVLYTADGIADCTKYHYSIGKYEKINLLKIPHHGVSDGVDYFYMKALNPDVAICNVCVDHERPSAPTNNVLDSLGCKIGFLSKADAQYVSLNGNVFADLSEQNIYRTIETDSPTSVTFYVDSAATGLGADGSQTHPYNKIKTALYNIPDNGNISVNIQIADGSYGDLNVVNRKSTVKLSGANITLGALNITNCNVAQFAISNLVVTSLNVNDSNIDFEKSEQVTVNANKAIAVFFNNTNAFFTKLIYDGTNLPAGADDRGIMIYSSKVTVVNITVSNIGRGINVKRSSVYGGNVVNASNVTTLFTIVGPFLGIIQIESWGTLTNVTNLLYGKDKFVDIPARP